MFYAKTCLEFGTNPDAVQDGAGFGSTIVLNVNLKMLKHSEKNEVCLASY